MMLVNKDPEYSFVLVKFHIFDDSGGGGSVAGGSVTFLSGLVVNAIGVMFSQLDMGIMIFFMIMVGLLDLIVQFVILGDGGVIVLVWVFFVLNVMKVEG